MKRYRGKYRSDSFRLQHWDYGSPGFYYVTICTKNRDPYFGEVVAVDNWLRDPGPWDGMRGGIAGTHDYASLPPAAQSAQSRGAQSAQSPIVHSAQSPIEHSDQSPAARSAHSPLAQPAKSRIAYPAPSSIGHPASHAANKPGTESTVVVKLSAIGQIAQQYWIDIPKHFPFVALDEFVIMPNHLHGILSFKKPGYRQRASNVFGPQSQNLGSVIRNFKGATKAYATRNDIRFAWQSRYHDDVITSFKELKNIRRYIHENPARWVEKQRLNNHV